MTTTKKSPRKFALPKKGGAKKGAEPKAHFVDEPTGDAASAAAGLVPIDDEFEPLPASRNNDALIALLKSIAGTSDKKIAALTPPITREAFIAALTEDEYARVWAWAREISYVCSQDNGSARESVLQVPACLIAIVDDDLIDVPAMIDNSAFDAAQVVRDLTPAEASSGEPSNNHQATQPEAAPSVGADNEAANAGPIKQKPKGKSEQLPLVDEPKSAPKQITALTLATQEQATSVRRALEARMKNVTALAKKNRDEGKEVEAKSVEKEAQMIKETLLSQLKPQTAMALNEHETLPSVVARTFQGKLRWNVKAALLKNLSLKKGETKADAEARALSKLDDMEALLGNIGEQAGALVVSLVSEAAERGIEKGKASQQCTAAAVAREALQALEMQAAS